MAAMTDYAFAKDHQGGDPWWIRGISNMRDCLLLALFKSRRQKRNKKAQDVGKMVFYWQIYKVNAE